MNLTTQLTGTLPKQGGQGGGNVTIKLNGPVPPAMREGLQPPLHITVGKTAEGQTTLTLPNGHTLAATLQPPLAEGTRLTLPTLPTLTGTTLTAKIAKAILQQPAPPPPTGQPATPPTPAAPQPVPPQIVLINPPPITETNPIPLPPQVVPAPANTLPAGPAGLTVTNPRNVPLPATLVITATHPAQTGQPQQVTLNIPIPAPHANAPTPPPITLHATLNAGQPLPVNRPVQAILLSPTTPPAPQASTAPQSHTILLPTTPVAPPQTSQNLTQTSPQPPFSPPTSTTLQSLSLLFGQNTALPATPFTARITGLPQPAIAGGQPGFSHSTLLSTGSTTSLVSPTPLPAGTVLTMSADITTPITQIHPTVLRLTPTNANPQQQQQTGFQSTTGQPAPTQTQQAPPPVGSIVQATVTGQTTGTPPQAILTINTTPYQGQTFTLPTTQPLPTGTAVQLQFQPNLQAHLLSYTLPQGYLRSHAGTTLAHGWQNLATGLNHLAGTNPQLAQLARNQLTPTAFLATFLVYARNLFAAEPTPPLPREAATALHAMGLDFSPDMQQLTALARPPETPEQWRAFFFPYVEDPNGDPQQGRFFWRQQKDENAEEKSRPSTRFVLEVAFSRLGTLQLDGLVTYPEIWLKLRGHRPFPEDITQQLRALTSNTLTALGMTGGITVETTASFPVNPLADIMQEDPSSVSVET